MAHQLRLPLPARSALGREDYFVSDANSALLAALDSADTWHGGRLAIFGAEGSGKTHLAHVFAQMYRAKIYSEIADPDKMAQGPVVLDDADLIKDETAFLHLYNLMGQNSQLLLLTARQAPSRWTIELPDLASRLGSVTAIEIGPPDDALLTAVLAKHFADRGISPSPRLIPYLVPRIERSLAVAGSIVAALDEDALAEGRAPSVQLASRLLDRLSQ